MQVIKYGGKILSSSETRKVIYKSLKNIDDKVVMVVSAFKDTHFSTCSFSSLIDNSNMYVYEHLLTMGEQIATLIVYNEMLNNHFNVDMLPVEELGITISKKNEDIQIVSLDNTKIKERLEKCDILLVCGFIAFDEEHHIRTLNRNGGDFTAVLMAAMLNLNKVTCYKDVLGVCVADPFKFNSPNVIENISYQKMLSFIRHGCNAIQYEAVKYAKDNGISICIQHFGKLSPFTIVDNKTGDSTCGINIKENDVFIDGFSNGNILKSVLYRNQIPYDMISTMSDFTQIRGTGKENTLTIAKAVYNHLFNHEKI